MFGNPPPSKSNHPPLPKQLEPQAEVDSTDPPSTSPTKKKVFSKINAKPKLRSTKNQEPSSDNLTSLVELIVNNLGKEFFND